MNFSATAQARAAQYIDLVYPYGKSPVAGTIVSYEYGKQVVMVLENGDLKEIPWKEVKRVNFRIDNSYNPEIDDEEDTGEVAAESAVLPTPERKLRHQVTSSLTFGNTLNSNGRFNTSRTTIGGGVAYHLLRDVSALTVGTGLDVSLMNHQRRENVLAATVRNGGWGKMTLDLGYRFLNSRFNLTTSNLDVVERNVMYRRLSFRGGMRF